MKKIIVFTNPTSWANLPQDPMPLAEDVVEINNDEILSVDLNSITVSSISNINESLPLILIYDEIKQERFNSFIENYNEELFILYHKNSGKFKLELPNTSEKKEGSHTSTDGSGYYELSKLLTKKKVEIEQIIKDVFGVDKKLNTALEFLHKCLLNSINNDDINKVSETLALNEKDLEIIKKCNDNNLENLTKARDLLLKNI